MVRATQNGTDASVPETEQMRSHLTRRGVVIDADSRCGAQIIHGRDPHDRDLRLIEFLDNYRVIPEWRQQDCAFQAQLTYQRIDAPANLRIADIPGFDHEMKA